MSKSSLKATHSNGSFNSLNLENLDSVSCTTKIYLRNTSIILNKPDTIKENQDKIRFLI